MLFRTARRPVRHALTSRANSRQFDSFVTDKKGKTEKYVAGVVPLRQLAAGSGAGTGKVNSYSLILPGLVLYSLLRLLFLVNQFRHRQTPSPQTDVGRLFVVLTPDFTFLVILAKDSY